MARLTVALILTVTAATVTIVTHHSKRPVWVASEQPAPVPIPLAVHVSRGEVRLPLLGGRRLRETAARKPDVPGPSRWSAAHLPGNGNFADTTMYCATGSRNAAGRWPRLGDVAVLDRSIPFGTRVRIDGNVYTVEDWIGSGSSWDIFGGDDAGCEARALDYGRRHLRVVVER